MAVATIWTVEHTCGHSEDHDLTEIPVSKRAGRADWYAKRKCFDCFRAESGRTISKDRAKENAQALQIARDYAEQQELAVLHGSEKQIDWALTVRHTMLLSSYEELVQAGEMDDDEYEQAIIAPARLVDAAKFWIDNRDMSVTDLAELLADPDLLTSDAVSTENPL